jgi:hypothetical protein
MAITLANLKNKLASYSTNGNQVASWFVQNGFDLLLDAINQSHAKAQQNYGFENSRCDVTYPNFTISTGGVLTPATSVLTGLQVPVKNIVNVQIVDPSGSGLRRPINFAGQDSEIEDLRERWKALVWSLDIRYPAFPIPLTGSYPPWIIQQGPNLAAYPPDPTAWGLGTDTTPFTLYCSVRQLFPDLHDTITSTATSTTTGSLIDTATDFVASGVQVGDTIRNTTTAAPLASSTVTNVATHNLTLADQLVNTSGDGYVLASPLDFLFTNGDDFLFYDCLCRLNELTKQFCQRQEGNVPPPTDKRDKAWEDLKKWDSNWIAEGTTSFNLD